MNDTTTATHLQQRRVAWLLLHLTHLPTWHLHPLTPANHAQYQLLHRYFHSRLGTTTAQVCSVPQMTTRVRSSPLRYVTERSFPSKREFASLPNHPDFDADVVDFAYFHDASNISRPASTSTHVCLTLPHNSLSPDATHSRSLTASIKP